MSVGIKIKEYRIKNGFTQKDLADKLHVTYQAVSKWENNLAEPSFETLEEICKLFNCSITEFFNENNKPNVSNNNQNTNYVNHNPNVNYVNYASPLLLGICTDCGKSIYNKNDFHKIYETVILGKKRDKFKDKKEKILCSNCLNRLNEQKKREEEIKYKRIKETSVKRRKNSLIFSILISLILIFIAIVFFKNDNTTAGTAFIISSILAFTFVGVMFFNNTFIPEMWLEISSWGFVKLPGLIYEFSIDGFIWMISMKILFWIIGFVLALIASIFATLICALLSIFVYPFAFSRNIRMIGIE